MSRCAIWPRQPCQPDCTNGVTCAASGAYMTDNNSKKEKIVDALLRAVWHNIWMENPDGKTEGVCFRRPVENNFQNAFMNRVRGFLAELNYFDLTVERLCIFRGGWFVPKPNKDRDPLTNSCYFSVSTTAQGQEQVYKALGQALPSIPMYVIVPVDAEADIHCLSEDSYHYFLFSRETGQFSKKSPQDFYSFWEKKSQQKEPTPDIEAHGNKSVLDEAKRLLLDSEISAHSLQLLLYDRDIFDVQISSKRCKGRPTDLDFIKLKRDGTIFLIDVKDKYLSRDNKLGMNRDHIAFFKDIDEKLGTSSMYVVRLSESKWDRSLKGWYYAPIHKFLDAEDSVGKPGMNGVAAMQTPMLTINEFKCWPSEDKMQANHGNNMPASIE